MVCDDAESRVGAAKSRPTGPPASLAQVTPQWLVWLPGKSDGTVSAEGT